MEESSVICLNATDRFDACTVLLYSSNISVVFCHILIGSLRTII